MAPNTRFLTVPSPLGDPEIAPPQLDPVPPGKAGQLLDRLVDQPGVGRMGHSLGLDRGDNRDPLEVLGRQGARLMGDPQALLKQRRQALLAEPLAPARHRRAIEGQLVPEHMLAAEILEVRVLDPARAERLVA
jgi:hypothetical protein